MNIGNNLKQLRKNNNLTQKQLANMLNLSTATIQSYELNRRTPSIDILQKISSLFSVDLQSLIKQNTSLKISYATSELTLFSDLINEMINENDKYITQDIYQILRLFRECLKTAKDTDSFSDIIIDLIELSKNLNLKR